MTAPVTAKQAGMPPVKREVRELALLFEISQTLDRILDLRDAVGPVLQAMARHMGMLRGTIVLLNRETHEITIEAAYGLSTSQQERGRYKLGEGVTGKVVATGRPAVVPRINEEPLFLNRTGARKGLRKKDISFICVPIKMGNEVIGALSADRLFSEVTSTEEDVRLLSIIASLIAQAARLRQSAQEERLRLVEENLRLQEELKDRFRPANIIGNSKAMQAVYDLIAQVARTQTTVLLRGESGVGKELAAHAIHYNSDRADRAFVKVNCAASSATRRGPSRARSPSGKAASNSARAARSSWTRSATSRPTRRYGCCGSSRSASSSAWAARRRSRPTPASSRPRTATSKRWSRRTSSARTCITG
jgi:Nif-specific regulatory protein